MPEKCAKCFENSRIAYRFSILPSNKFINAVITINQTLRSKVFVKYKVLHLNAIDYQKITPSRRTIAQRSFFAVNPPLDPTAIFTKIRHPIIRLNCQTSTYRKPSAKNQLLNFVLHQGPDTDSRIRVKLHT